MVWQKGETEHYLTRYGVCLAVPNFLNFCEALKTVVYILNRVPTKVVPKTSFELFNGWKSSLRHVHIQGCSYEVRVYNPQKTKLDPRTISGYFVGYVEKSKGYRFYCPSHTIRFVESRNAKFLENDIISGSDLPRNTISKKNHPEPFTSSNRLVITHKTPQVQLGVEQPITEVPQIAKINPRNQIAQQLLETIEQLVEQHAPQEDAAPTLRRSTRTTRSTIPSDYIVYLQESDYNVGAKNDPDTFSQAMSCKESDMWYNSMKEEMNSGE